MTAHRKLFLYFIAIVIFGISIVYLPFIITYGQELLSKQGLEITPPSQEVNAKPGKEIKVQMKVRNPGSTPLPIKVRVEDFTASGEEGQVALTEKSNYSVTGWTTISPENFTLSPKAEQTVTATIRVPSGAAGGRYGALVFQINPQKPDPNTNAASVAQEIAGLFLVKIEGPTEERLLLERISAPIFSEFGPINLKMKFINTGNIFTKTGGLINITNMFGQKVTDVVVKPTNVFPGANRVIIGTVPNKFMIGFYTASAAMYYGTANNVLNATTTFFVFPVRLVAAIIIVLFFFYATRKRLKKAGKALFG